MNLYVESNFVLELVFEQEQTVVCRDLLSLHGTKVTICIPGFSLLEPQYALYGQRDEREKLATAVLREADRLEKSEQYRRGLFTPVREIGADFARLNELYENSYNQLVRRLANEVKVLPLTPQVITLSSELTERGSFSRFDSVILASILVDLASTAPLHSCFVTKDEIFARRASRLPELLAAKCTVKDKFADAYQYLIHTR